MVKMLGCDGTLPAGDAEVHGVWLVNLFDEFEPIPHRAIYGCHVDLYVTFLDLA
jgi:hypothetical protein